MVSIIEIEEEKKILRPKSLSRYDHLHGSMGVIFISLSFCRTRLRLLCLGVN